MRSFGLRDIRQGLSTVGDGLICTSGWRHCCGSLFGIVTGSAKKTIKRRGTSGVYGTGTVRGSGLITGVSTGIGTVFGTIFGTCAGVICGATRGTNSSSVNGLVTGGGLCTHPAGVINHPAGQFGLLIHVYIRIKTV